MQATVKLFFSFLLCLSLVLLSGCGGGKNAANNSASESAPHSAGDGNAEEEHATSDSESKITASSSDAPIAESVPKAEPPSQDAPPVRRRGVPYQAPGKDIFEAALWGTIRDIEHHLANGADINTPQSGTGNTPLHNAVINSNSGLEMVRYLVSKGAEINVHAKGGNTPLHNAAISPWADVEILRFLISNGASVTAKNDVGKTPLDFAAMNQYKSEEKQSIIREAMKQ